MQTFPGRPKFGERPKFGKRPSFEDRPKFGKPTFGKRPDFGKRACQNAARGRRRFKNRNPEEKPLVTFELTPVLFKRIRLFIHIQCKQEFMS